MTRARLSKTMLLIASGLGLGSACAGKAMATIKLDARDSLVIETPGGGGFGKI